MNAVPTSQGHCEERDATRPDGLPWVHLVLSLLLLGAPALAIALEAAGQGRLCLTGSLDQSAQAASSKGNAAKGVGHLSFRQAELPAAAAVAVSPWRDARRYLASATHALAQVYHWVQPAPFSHGRVIDPAYYLQRTLR